ncbi:MAG: pyruvate kinase [Candidatus Alkaliphilus sp. MAG34]|mgnify:FL=1|nr:pyruvate kinase [Clostridiales bacterium]
MKKTKIVCTIGPASESRDIFEQLVVNGLDVARLNFSHGDHEEHEQRINTIKEVRWELNKSVAILLDTKGSEIRTGKFKDGEVELKEGQNFTITTRDVLGDDTICSISYDGLPKDVKIGNTILIDDGLVGLRVEKIIDNTDIECVVENGGIISDHKGVNVPNVKLNLPSITEKDKLDIEFGIKKDVDFIAASFVRKASDVLAIREVLEKNNVYHIQVISKIENQEGLDNIDEIIRVSDGIMIARGDLGVEISTEEIPLAQKELIRKCNKAGKPVITATQMLDSMIRNPRPTRAEATDVANAIFDGTDAIMLSGETAMGKYPVEAVKIMSDIAKRTEKAINYADSLEAKSIERERLVTDAISYATCRIAADLGASAILTATATGFTARMVSKFRPAETIVAAVTDERIRRRLALSWGVNAVLTKRLHSTDDVIAVSVEKALEAELINSGDLVVITAGVPVGASGTTNLIKVHTVGEVILFGTAIGNESITGKVVIVVDGDDYDKVKEGDILVTKFTDKELVPLMEKASAIITEEGGLTSHGAIVGLNLRKTTLVGAYMATKKLNDGEIITIDAKGGLVYRGKTRVF